MEKGPVKKTALRNIAVDALKDMIINHGYQPGTPIREADVSELLGISRVPVREAFRILEHEGIVEYIPNCGVRVKTFTKKEIIDLYQVRLMIDMFIADNLLENITDIDLRELNLITKRMLNRNDFPLCNDLFHQKLILLSQNGWILKIWDTIESQVRLVMISCATTDKLHMISLSLHQDIIKALEARDKEQYLQAIKQHTSVALEYILQELSSQ